MCYLCVICVSLPSHEDTFLTSLFVHVFFYFLFLYYVHEVAPLVSHPDCPCEAGLYTQVLNQQQTLRKPLALAQAQRSTWCKVCFSWKTSPPQKYSEGYSRAMWMGPTCRASHNQPDSSAHMNGSRKSITNHNRAQITHLYHGGLVYWEDYPSREKQITSSCSKHIESVIKSHCNISNLVVFVITYDKPHA